MPELGFVNDCKDKQVNSLNANFVNCTRMSSTVSPKQIVSATTAGASATAVSVSFYQNGSEVTMETPAISGTFAADTLRFPAGTVPTALRPAADKRCL